jgi:SAM-dependent methyltransferase
MRRDRNIYQNGKRVDYGNKSLNSGRKLRMSINNTNVYDIEAHIAELYDLQETYTDDVELIQQHLSGLGTLTILEPFCGTGRISIPLVLDGHHVVGLDLSHAMLARARQKASDLPEDVQQRIQFIHMDVVAEAWPTGFDLVILGANCFYELATSDEQEYCIKSTAASLKSGGYVFVDNNHMEGELAESWQSIGVVTPGHAETCKDGAYVETSRETVWFDVPNRLARYRRRTIITYPDGRRTEHEAIQQKHPVSCVEVEGWLKKHGFILENTYGDRRGTPYAESSPRAIFWARKE